MKNLCFLPVLGSPSFVRPWLGVIGAAVIVTVAGCNDIASRIQEKIVAFNQLSTESQARIRDQNVAVGDSADMVYVAFGKPNTSAAADIIKGQAEVWAYRNIPASNPAVALQDNNPGARYQPSRESTSAPRNQTSLASTKSTGPSPTLEIGDAAMTTLYVGLVNGLVVRLSVSPLDPNTL